MDSSTERLLMTLFAFSDYFGVTPPQTNDIGEWWKNTLYEMTKWTKKMSISCMKLLLLALYKFYKS